MVWKQLLEIIEFHQSPHFMHTNLVTECAIPDPFCPLLVCELGSIYSSCTCFMEKIIPPPAPKFRQAILDDCMEMQSVVLKHTSLHSVLKNALLLRLQ